MYRIFPWTSPYRRSSNCLDANTKSSTILRRFRVSASLLLWQILLICFLFQKIGNTQVNDKFYRKRKYPLLPCHLVCIKRLQLLGSGSDLLCYNLLVLKHSLPFSYCLQECVDFLYVYECCVLIIFRHLKTLIAQVRPGAVSQPCYLPNHFPV